MRKAPKGSGLHHIDEDINLNICKVRARFEHPYRVIKRQFGYLKTHYRGLSKNRAQLFTLFALGNLFFPTKADGVRRSLPRISGLGPLDSRFWRYEPKIGPCLRYQSPIARKSVQPNEISDICCTLEERRLLGSNVVQ